MTSISDLSTGCRLDSWFCDIIRDPLSKDRLDLAEDKLRSSWGHCYFVNAGILDFRFGGQMATAASSDWHSGQLAYEAFAKALITRNKTVDFYQREIDNVRPVYEELPIRGACIDVGGFDGRVRTFMAPNAAYACVDPYINAISDIGLQPTLTSAYPELKDPRNFVCGLAEHLPIAGGVFDTVHMRSVIDHIGNPYLALLEANRVLRFGGQLIIGASIDGGPSGSLSLKERARECARSILVGFGFERYRDHHIWHPTMPELTNLIVATGFVVDKVHWQASENGRVAYVRATKT
jgi:SAM-dependent methyltransferase